jgi:hypothetical protein
MTPQPHQDGLSATRPADKFDKSPTCHSRYGDGALRGMRSPLRFNDGEVMKMSRFLRMG